MLSMVAVIFNLLIAIAFPVGVLVYALVKKREMVLPVVIGALTFLCSQLLTRIPLLTILAGNSSYVAFTLVYPTLYALLLGLSAGVFEEGGRFIAMTLMRRHRGYSTAIYFGLGHGGFEALMLVGLSNLNLLITNPGLLSITPPWMIAMAGVERIFAILAHVAFSVMVMRAVTQRKPLWLVAAILAHGLMDASIVLMQQAGFGIIVIEVALALMAVALFVYILMARPKIQLNTTLQEVPYEENH